MLGLIGLYFVAENKKNEIKDQIKWDKEEEKKKTKRDMHKTRQPHWSPLRR